MKDGRDEAKGDKEPWAPLYQEAVALLPGLEAPTGEANLGLYFDKFFDQWAKGTWQVDGGRKRLWLQGVVGKAAQAGKEGSGANERLSEATERLRALAHALGGRAGELSTVWRFVSGTGRPHPVEVGFAWYHTLGVPYLPGTSLKGLVRAWAEATDWPPKSLEDVFGSREKVGSVVFFDVLPVAVPQLVVEVMTPHYGGWGPEDPPGDWRSPVPVYFLAVESGQRFVAAVAPRPGAGPVDMEAVWGCTLQALSDLGAGAKTTAGFGQMSLQEELRVPRAEPPPLSLVDEVRAQGGQTVYERARKFVHQGVADPAQASRFVKALEEAGYLGAWREGRKHKDEVSGPKKLRELAQQLAALVGDDGRG